MRKIKNHLQFGGNKMTISYFLYYPRVFSSKSASIRAGSTIHQLIDPHLHSDPIWHSMCDNHKGWKHGWVTAPKFGG